MKLADFVRIPATALIVRATIREGFQFSPCRPQAVLPKQVYRALTNYVTEVSEHTCFS